MKKRFVFVLLVVAGIVGFGFYRGWFTVDQGKIQQDEQLVKEEVRELLKGAEAKPSEGTEKVKEQQ